MSLDAFQKRIGIPLSKAVHADDFKGIRQSIDPKGADSVDHMPDLSAHPRSLDAKVEEYRKAISAQAPMMRLSPDTLAGVTPKILYKLYNSTNLPTGNNMLVKPYHEQIHPKSKYWMEHPIQGWAEMTSQALYHAAGMGDMHQKVHVSEHDMGPGLQKHPALVIHMEPNAEFVGDMQPWMYDRSMHQDALKIGVMDFLSNNLDRHTHNMLVRPEGAVNEQGLPYSSRLIAIDHGRCFQYHASHKGARKQFWDAELGWQPVPPEEQERINQWGKTQDNIFMHLSNHAHRILEISGRQNGMRRFRDKSVLYPFIAEWWPSVRNRVISTFADRLAGIKENNLKMHLFDNFSERTNKLDDIAARPDFYARNHSNWEGLSVPLRVWNRP